MKPVVIFLHAFAGWALCAATMGVGMSTMAESTALLVHAVLAPVFFAALSVLYFSIFDYTKSHLLAGAAVSERVLPSSLNYWMHQQI